MSASKPVVVQAGRREWVGLAVLALPCMLYSMDLTVLNLAVPKLSAALRPTSSELLWIVDIYGFVLAGALIPMGVLGDRIGRRRLLLMGAAAFGCASVLAAFAPSVEALIAARALLGLAAATLAPSTLSLLRSMFLDDEGTHIRGRGLDCQLLGRGCDRTPDRRGTAPVLLVGLRIPDQPSSHGATARRGPEAAPRIPGSEGGQAGHRERRPVHRHGSGRHLRSQAHRRARRGLDGGGDTHPGPGDRRYLPAPAAKACPALH